MARGQRKALIVLALLGIVAAGATSAAARQAESPSPSSAQGMEIGVPFTASFSETYYTWIRTPSLRRKDEVVLAVSNDGEADINLCFTSPVDDFGADEAVADCRWGDDVDSGRKARQRWTYGGSTGQPFFIVYNDCGSCGGAFTITLERVSHWLAVGWTKRSSVNRQLTLKAAARYGDNAAAVDGTPVGLWWRRSGTKPWKKLTEAKASRGSVNLRATLPASTRGKRVDLSACGGDIGQCAFMTRVAVR